MRAAARQAFTLSAANTKGALLCDGAIIRKSPNKINDLVWSKALPVMAFCA
jgi:hypothetical protein